MFIYVACVLCYEVYLLDMYGLSCVFTMKLTAILKHVRTLQTACQAGGSEVTAECHGYSSWLFSSKSDCSYD